MNRQDPSELLIIHAQMNCLIEVQRALKEVHARKDYALRISAKYGYRKIVKKLLLANADVHAEYDEALRVAAEYGRTEIVQMLLRPRFFIFEVKSRK